MAALGKTLTSCLASARKLTVTNCLSWLVSEQSLVPVWTITCLVSSRGDWLVRLAEKSPAVASPTVLTWILRFWSSLRLSTWRRLESPIRRAARLPSLGSRNEGGTCLDLFTRMSSMVLSAELSVAVLFVDSCIDCSELRVEELVVVAVVVDRRDVVLLSFGGVWGIGRRPVWVCPSSFCALGERPDVVWHCIPV